MTHDTTLLSALSVPVFTTDADGTITFFNEAAAQLWGRRPEVGKEKWCGSWRLYRTDGRPLAHDECPVAQSLKQARDVHGAEVILERPDGTQLLFCQSPTIVRDVHGAVAGTVTVLQDLSERRRSEADAAHMAAIVYSSNDAIISKTLGGIITSWNNAASMIFGYAEAEMIGRSIMTLIPPDLRHEEEEIISRIKKGERIEHYETVRMRKDGRKIDISITVSPVLDKNGRVIGASKVARDITERKKAERLRQLLTNELDHRVKNTLATVQAIASQSLHHAKSPAEFTQSFSGRIQAMAMTHSLLTQNHKHHVHGAELTDLVRSQVLLGGGDPRVSHTGPPLMLGTQEAVHLALVLHELATNARKYGALSVPEGQLAISWFTRAANNRELVLEWRESGGPTVTEPRRFGFGDTLIRTTLKAHAGDATIVYASTGVICTLELVLQPEQLTLPIYTASKELEAQNLRQRPLQQTGATKPQRILIVEDEPLVSMDLESCVRDAGHQVVGPATTIEAARKLATEGNFDVALLDVNLAGTSIEEVADIVASHRIPFGFVTGYGQAALPVKFKTAAILGKPFNPADVVNLVSRLSRTTSGADADVIPLRTKTQQPSRLL
jgi:PAS domain S-box-containing protein